MPDTLSNPTPDVDLRACYRGLQDTNFVMVFLAGVPEQIAEYELCHAIPCRGSSKSYKIRTLSCHFLQGFLKIRTTAFHNSVSEMDVFLGDHGHGLRCPKGTVICEIVLQRHGPRRSYTEGLAMATKMHVTCLTYQTPSTLRTYETEGTL